MTLANPVWDLTVHDVGRWIKGRFADNKEIEGPKSTPKREAMAVVDPAWHGGEGLEIPYGTYQIKGLQVVEKMMKDEMFGTGVELKKSVALSSDYEIEPGIADDEKSIEIAESVKAGYDFMEDGIIEAMADQLTAIEYGFSIANVVYDVIDAGDFKGLIGLNALKTKPPWSYKFDVDGFMNIKPNGILFATPQGRIEPHATDEFAIYTYRKRMDNPYGYGDALRAYDRWNSKTWVVKYWDIYLERTGNGTVIFQYDRENKPPKSEFDAVKSFVDKKQVRSALRISKDWDFTWQESTGTGGKSFENAVNHRNIAIARSIMLPDQIGFSDSSTAGSFAKAKVHLDVFMMPIMRLHRDLERVHNKQIIKRLVDYNYGPQGKYPKLKFNPLTEEAKVLWLTNVITAVEKGVIKSDLEVENAVRRHLELAEKEKEEEVAAGGSPPPGLDKEKEIDLTKLQAPDRAVKLRPLTKYEKKVDINAVIAFMNDTQENFVTTWAAHMKDNKKALMDTVKRKNLVALGDYQGVDDLKMKRNADQKKSFARFNMASVYFGALQGEQEIGRAKSGNYEMSEYKTFDPNNIPLTEIEKYFQGLGLTVSPAIRAASRAAKNRAFWITGVENDKILAQAKIILGNGIERGDQMWAMKEMEKLFAGHLKTGQLVDGALGEAYRIETIARNNFVRAISQGRKAMFESKEVADFVVAYQWSSILDSATTDYCRELDEKIFSKEELNSIGWPPAHHNCRSFVTPITEGEKYKIDKMPIGITRADGFDACEHGELLEAVN